ncbi:SMI1/KNR4 family protein [Hymenobacter arizonensis]|uniref:Knr4/Smi1-like domain-containing protein n=1 Tax=Hymenobacter arizonensis TaxID=1227077 RepID=A0A1I6BR79_HYMAR|nr:SMI1/KNR4 family protein [Hymenobacter arizonensis]SFQ83423.1 hypothetical protein SAMN04515668_4963 [Hymenobacter arizonensis]
MSAEGHLLVREYVDAALAFLAAHDLMRILPPVADAMQDPSRPVAAGGGWGDDWFPWKPIASTVTAADIAELEAAIGARFPALYVDFLCYRHFYELDAAAGVSFLMHDVKYWKAGLLHHYFYLPDPGTPTQQGFVMFAYDPELKSLCFDVNRPTPDGRDCAVVRVLDLYQDPAPTQLLYHSFFDLLVALRAAQRQRDTLSEQARAC